jgi:catechol 2,3-dioxygenase-like lactoylglutathione lyase family enzyme
MKTQLGHVEVKIDTANSAFYKDLLQFLGWNTIWEGEGMLGLGGADGASLWFSAAVGGGANDYDRPGVNHLGISVSSQADVDATAAYLRSKSVPALFETPRHRPEFASNADETYYQVMFESPDRVLFEVVYTGPKG